MKMIVDLKKEVVYNVAATSNKYWSEITYKEEVLTW